jgi:hypothetical protein
VFRHPVTAVTVPTKASTRHARFNHCEMFFITLYVDGASGCFNQVPA